MLFSSIITLAWLVKPIIGYIIDNFFNKKVWIFFALTLDIITALVLGFMPLPIFTLIFILLINSTNTAFRDVAVDGIMCVEGKIYNLTGKIQSIQWLSISLAGLINGVWGGYIAEKWGYRVGFLFLIPVYLMVAIAAYFYTESQGLNKKVARQTLFTPHQSGAGFTFTDLKRLFTDKKLLIIALFIFLYRYSPSFGTPLFFIQRDTFKWGKLWIGTLGTIGTVFQIIGSLFYYKFNQKIEIKKWLYASVFLGATTTLSYLYYTPITAVVYDILYSFLGMFIFLVVLDFMARNTVKGLEATSFALLCSVSNLAQTASSLSGAALLPILGLKWLIVLSSLTSFLCLCLIKKI